MPDVKRDGAMAPINRNEKPGETTAAKSPLKSGHAPLSPTGKGRHGVNQPRSKSTKRRQSAMSARRLTRRLVDSESSPQCSI
jgi:hypothetical protein